MNNILVSSFFIFLTFLHSNLFSAPTAHKIELLVNDEIITSYDISQHLAINLLLNKIKLTNENKEFLYNQTVEELIEMYLQKIKVDEYEVELTKDENEYYQEFFYAQRNIKKEDFLKLAKINKLNATILTDKIEIMIKWQKLTSGLFFRTTSITESEVDDLMNKNESLTRDMAERTIRRRQIDLKANKYLRDLRSEANIEIR